MKRESATEIYKLLLMRVNRLGEELDENAPTIIIKTELRLIKDALKRIQKAVKQRVEF